ncbi:MAG: hypothetical protein H6502_03190 [Candidatus Woesearchaeota archaeon]|nr:MAG: hypothetical protein H6502_03190 [Candidatus Woesearchaeota archaeon]
MARRHIHKKQSASSRHEEHTHHASAQKKVSQTNFLSSFWEGFSAFFSRKEVLAVIAILLFLAPLLLSLHIRLYPVDLPVTKTWAENSINDQIKSQLAASVVQRFGATLPPDRVNELVEEEFQKVLSGDPTYAGVLGGQDYDTFVQARAEGFKSRLQNDNGETYLVAIDPYFYMRRVDNIIESGTVCDEIVDGQCRDNHMFAPIGIPTSAQFHEQLGAAWYRFLHAFNGNITPFFAFFLLPAFLSSLVVVPGYFLMKKKYGVLAAFFSALFLATNVAFLGRTSAGFSDTDSYTLLFPLFILWALVPVFDRETTWQKRVLFSGIAGFLFGWFSLAWTGWTYFFIIVTAALLVKIAYYFAKHLVSLYPEIFHVDTYLYWGAGMLLLVELLIGMRLGYSLFSMVVGVVLSFILYFLLRVSIAVVRKKKWNALKTFFTSKTFSHYGLTFVLFTIFSGIFVSLFTTVGVFLNVYRLPFIFSILKTATQGFTIMPNVLTTVAELNPASLGDLIHTNGGTLIFFLATIGLLLSFFRKVTHTKIESWFIVGSIIFYLIVLYSRSSFSLDLLSFLALFSIPFIIILVYGLLKDSDIDLSYSLLLFIWLIAIMYASSKGIRFVMLSAPVVALGIGILVSKVYGYIEYLISKWDKVTTVFSARFITLVIVLVFATYHLAFIPVVAANNAAMNEVPSMNDAWWSSLEKIKNEAAPDAIVTSWWDFGHWFKYVADRGVTFDGASQGSNAHSVGNILAQTDEEVALRTLRLISCGQNEARDAIIAHFDGKEYRGMIFLKELLTLDTNEHVRTHLEEAEFSEDEISYIMEMGFCQPPENYFITSEDMVSKAGVWGHFGFWDFKRALAYSTMYGKTKEKGTAAFLDRAFDATEEEATRLYFEVNQLANDVQANSWISPWPGFYNNRAAGCTETVDEDLGRRMLSCNVGIGLGRDSQGLTVAINGIEVNFAKVDGKTVPKATFLVNSYAANNVRVNQVPARIPAGTFSFYEDGTLLSYRNATGENLLLSIYELPNGQFGAVVSDPLFENSLFLRLMFFEGVNTKYFEKFSDQTSLLGQRIIIWKVAWPEFS